MGRVTSDFHLTQRTASAINAEFQAIRSGILTREGFHILLNKKPHIDPNRIAQNEVIKTIECFDVHAAFPFRASASSSSVKSNAIDPRRPVSLVLGVSLAGDQAVPIASRCARCPHDSFALHLD